MRFTKKTAIVAATGSALALAVGGIALAYWTATGSGDGTAATSNGVSSLTVAQSTVLTPLYPGDLPQTISGTVKNTAANSAYVTSVTASIASVTGGTGTCDASDYTLTSPTMAIGQDVASNGTATFTGATLQFNNKTTNQDGCKGATVNLHYASN